MSAFDDWIAECEAKIPYFKTKEFVVIALFERIFKECFNAGMTRAAEICKEFYSAEQIAQKCAEAIEKARDGE